MRRHRCRNVMYGALIMALAAALLAACHPLVNPADPNSTAFTGERTDRDEADEVEPVLPSVIRWESVAEHAPGQFLALEIAEDGTFVEPRQPASPQRLFIVLTFDDTIDWEMISDATLFLRVSVPGGHVSLTAPLEIYEGTAVRNQATLRLEPDAPPFFNSTGDGPGGSMFRMRLVDPTGIVLGERLFGLLPGDFDGNGVVEYPADWAAGPDAYDGYLASPEIPETIRADADASGSVNVATITSRDGDLSSRLPSDTPPGNLNVTLPAPPPEF